MGMEDIAKARQYLIENLPPQTGPQEDYYEELKKGAS
jgi:hypothetical protein